MGIIDFMYLLHARIKTHHIYVQYVSMYTNLEICTFKLLQMQYFAI